jgi:hypothetical protein
MRGMLWLSDVPSKQRGGEPRSTRDDGTMQVYEAKGGPGVDIHQEERNGQLSWGRKMWPRQGGMESESLATRNDRGQG